MVYTAYGIPRECPSGAQCLPVTETRALSILILAFSLFLSITRVYEPDTFWQIRTGQLVVEEARVPQEDVFSLDSEGKPWVVHSWLADVIFFGAYRAGGFQALTFLKAVLVSLAFLFIFGAAVRCGANPFYAAFMTACFLLAARFRFTERPHIFTLFFLALFARILSTDGILARRKRFYLLPLLTLLWANLHAGVIFGVGLLGIHSICRAARPVLKRRMDKGGPGGPDARGLFIATGLSFLATLVNPQGPALYAFAQSQSSVREYARITEFLPLLSRATLPHVIFAAFLIFSVLLTLRRRRLEEVAVSLVFGILAISYRRMLPEFFAAAGPGLVLSARDLFAPIRNRLGARALSALGLAPLLLVLIGGYRAKRTDYLQLLGTGVLDLFFPERAIDFIRSQGLQGRMYNSTNLGGSVILKGYPVMKPFLDTRNELHEATLRELAPTLSRPEMFASFLTRHRLDLALVEPYQGYIARGLFPRKEWALLYWDDSAMVLARRNPENAKTIHTWEYVSVDPETTYEMLPGIVRDPARRRSSETELRRCLKMNPLASRARVLLGMLLSASSRWEEAGREFDRALKIQPYSFTANYEAAMFFSIRGEYGPALKYYRQAFALARVYRIKGAALARLYDEAGRAYESAGDIRRAKEMFRKRKTL